MTHSSNDTHISLSAFIEVQPQWAGRHRWQPGQQQLRYPTVAPTLWLMLEGEVEVTAEGRNWLIQPGEAFFMPQDFVRDITTAGGAEWLSAATRATLLRRVDLMALLHPPQVWRPGQDRVALEECLRQLAIVWSQRDVLSMVLAEGWSRALFGLCWQALAAQDLSQAAHNAVPPWLECALLHLDEHPDTTVTQWAKASGFSPAQFRRQFHVWFQIPPQAYLQRHRLEQARQLLKSSDESVSAIGARLGFYNASHFTRLFKRENGLPPASYRDASRRVEL